MSTAQSGYLFDLGPDGLGFILDPDGRQMWAFLQKDLDHPLADKPTAFIELEGSRVSFSMRDEKIRHIDICAKIPHRMAVAARR